MKLLQGDMQIKEESLKLSPDVRRTLSIERSVGYCTKDKFDVILITQRQREERGKGEEGFSTVCVCLSEVSSAEAGNEYPIPGKWVHPLHHLPGWCCSQVSF